MEKRNFSSRQRKALIYIQDNCNRCGAPLDRMEADHIIPFSRGGKTELVNGQGLCPKCNKSKSDKFMVEPTRPRGWQIEGFERLKESFLENKKLDFMLVAGVGSGKTFFSGYAFNFFKRENIFDSIVIISPTENIKRGWSTSFQKYFDIKIDHGYRFKHSWPRDCQGISITYQSLTAMNVEILKKYINKRVLLVIDEVHHAGDEKAWGENILYIGEDAGFRLLLSGTPDRSDNAPIPFVTYSKIFEKKFRLNYDYYYSYQQSVEDGICCPAIFPEQQSKAKTVEGFKTLQTASDDDLEQKRIYNQIIKVNESEDCYVFETFEKANLKLNEINDSSIEGNRAGLIVCNTIQDSQNLYKLLYDKYGSDFCTLVTSDDVEASQKIEDFKYSEKSWIICIKMVSEGVDIPRLRVIVYASNVTTMIFFMQVMGRAVRNAEKYVDRRDICYMYLPQYKPLIDNARSVMNELAHIYKEIEKEEEDFKKGIKIEFTPSLFDIVLESNSIDDGSTYAGSYFDVDTDTKATIWAKELGTSKDLIFEIMKKVSSETGIRMPDEMPKQIETITDEVERYKRMIKEVIGRIAYRLNIGQKPSSDQIRKIHWELNQSSGIRATNTASLKELKRKLDLAKQWLTKLNGNGKSN